MDLATIAAKQKRANDWGAFVADGGAQDKTIRAAIEDRLAQFKAALKRVWEAGAVSSDDAAVITDLERQLVQLNEEARIRVVGRRTSDSCCSGGSCCK